MRKLFRQRRIAIVLSVINAGGLIAALGAGEPLHAFAHMAAGAGLLMWLRHISTQIRAGGDEYEQVADAADRERIAGLENEVDQLRRELAEAQERMDFTERMLAQRARPITPV